MMPLTIQDIAELECNSNELLGLYEKQLNDEDLETICQILPNASEIKYLSLFGNLLTNRRLELLDKFQALTSLDLSDNAINIQLGCEGV